jgi:hypothetical protein
MYDHLAFLAQASPNAAEKLLETLIKDMKSLESNPHAYPYYYRPSSSPHRYRYVLSYSRYRIVYQIINDMVYVDDIQDCRQNDDKNII